jgi:hypothetical protein
VCGFGACWVCVCVCVYVCIKVMCVAYVGWVYVCTCILCNIVMRVVYVRVCGLGVACGHELFDAVITWTLKQHRKL